MDTSEFWEKSRFCFLHQNETVYHQPLWRKSKRDSDALPDFLFFLRDKIKGIPSFRSNLKIDWNYWGRFSLPFQNIYLYWRNQFCRSIILFARIGKIRDFSVISVLKFYPIKKKVNFPLSISPSVCILKWEKDEKMIAIVKTFRSVIKGKWHVQTCRAINSRKFTLVRMLPSKGP